MSVSLVSGRFIRVMVAQLVTTLPPDPARTVPVTASDAIAPDGSRPTSQMPVASLKVPAVAPNPANPTADGKTSVTWIWAVFGVPTLVMVRVKTNSSPTFTCAGATVLLNARLPGVRNKPASTVRLVWPEPSTMKSVMPDSESGSLSNAGSCDPSCGLKVYPSGG